MNRIRKTCHQQYIDASSSEYYRLNLKKSAFDFVTREILKAMRKGKIRTPGDKKLCEAALVSFGADVAQRSNKTTIDVSDIRNGWKKFLDDPRTKKEKKSSTKIYTNFPGRDKLRVHKICAVGLPPHSCMRTITINKNKLLERDDIVGVIIKERLQVK